ncbi:hypothetical protein evm_009099 [Chilo suppressalis]|nr:hypothetical protein evm_009099 [Chilo suppressalis]
MCQNIQSLTNKIDELNILLSEFNIDVIVMCEHWLRPSNYHFYSLEGYDLAAKYIRQNHKHGGVAIFTRESIKTRERLDIQSYTVEFVVEFFGIEIPEMNMLIISVYHPEGDREVETFFSQMQSLLEYVTKHNIHKKIIMGGDLNIDITVNTHISRRFINLLKSFGLRCINSYPTRITPTTSSCVDQFMVGMNVNMLTEVHHNQLSDHSTLIGQILLDSNVNENTTTVKKIKHKRLFSRKNMDNFRRALSTVNWQRELSTSNNLDENYGVFQSITRVLLDKYIPRKDFILKNKVKTVWVTKGIKKCCYHKRILRYLTTKFKNDSLIQYEKLYSKILKRIIQTEKRKYFIHRITTSKNKYKTMWTIINERTKSLKKNRQHNITINHNNKIITCPKTIANLFNNYYISIGKIENIYKPKVQNLNTLVNSFYLDVVTEAEVKKAILGLKRNNTCGYDDIPTTLIIHCVDEFVFPLTYLVNQSYEQGIFPQCLKQAIIVPIFKKGDKSKVVNYRPIAILSVISKIIEKIVCKRIYRFFEKYKVLNKNQHGFREKHSTTSAVLDCSFEILNALNENKCAVVVFMDVSKAYDRVLHEVLLKKLEQLGILGNTVKWLASYLKDRKQFVQIAHSNKGILENVNSEIYTLSGSIPQGSVLGCLMFLAYINDLSRATPHKIVQFADDATLIISGDYNDINRLRDEITSSINKIAKHLWEIGLELNLEKTKIMQFRPHQRSVLPLNVTFEHNEIEVVDTFVTLGITMDSTLSWKPHVSTVVNKLSSFTYALYELRKCTNAQCALTAYHAHAAAWIRYGIIFWGNSADVQEAFILQKRCIRVIANLSSLESCRPLPCWYRPEPAPQAVQLRPVVRTGVLRASDCKLQVQYCALHLPRGDIMRIRKTFRIQNVGNGHLDVQACTSGAWSIVMNHHHQPACGSGCGCVNRSGERTHNVALHYPPMSSNQMTVEVCIHTADVWPRVEASASTSPQYEQWKKTVTPLHFYDSDNVLLSIPLILKLEYPRVNIEPAAIDFGFVADGDTRKSYFTVSHSSRTVTLDLAVIWTGSDAFRLWPKTLLILPGTSERVYVQYIATWRGGPVEGVVRVEYSVGAGGAGAGGAWCAGAWCRAAAAVRAAPARDHKCRAPAHDYTDDGNLLPPDVLGGPVVPIPNDYSLS